MNKKGSSVKIGIASLHGCKQPNEKEDPLPCMIYEKKSPGHRITEELYQYTRDLLACGVYTSKEVAELTGLGKNTVKDIDKERL